MTDERCGIPSASSMDAEFRCLGRRALCRKVAPESESEFSRRGTKTHAYLSGDLKLDDLPRSDQATATKIQTEEARLVGGFQGATVIRERRLWVLNENMEKLYSTKVDAAYILGKRAIVIDYKTGFGSIIPLPRNWQMKCQVACVAFNYGCDEITASLIHPNEPDSLSQSMTFTREKIEIIMDEINGYLSQMTDDAPRTPNGISCQYCAAKEICPERKAWKESLAAKDGSFLKPDYEKLTPEEKGERLRQIKAWKKDADAEEDFYKGILADDPASVAGWKLVKGENRVIVNPVEAFYRIEKALGIERARTCMDISMSALEALLSESEVPKKEIPDRIKEILGDTLAKKPKKPSLREA